MTPIALLFRVWDMCGIVWETPEQAFLQPFATLYSALLSDGATDLIFLFENVVCPPLVAHFQQQPGFDHFGEVPPDRLLAHVRI
jgi:hypothetical protein